MGWFLLVIIQLLFAAEFLLFPLFLRALALGAKNYGFARDCTKVVIFAAAYAGERLLTWVMFYVAITNFSKGMFWVSVILMWVGFIIFLVLITFYALVLLRARSELE